ncbi:MAG: 2-acyl-glycerophospho-ethanolamine acyltransferase [Rhizobiaceae bacterium]|nr:2-acyl-glycerophospho-ethanolamine acyltransferase [Rhizobiaceae bacterium]
MVLALAVISAVVLAWIAGAIALATGQRISFRQAFLLVPIALAHRLGVRSGGHLHSDPPVVYAILHQSQLDPALMLSLLPADTLHILDEVSARSVWLDPWREIGRTIPFNPEHVFVSRRLVRHLKGNGRLAIYFPDGIEPETKAYRLYRAVARIALRAGACVVPVSVHGSRNTLFAPKRGQRRGPFARLRLKALEPLDIPGLVSRSTREQSSAAAALFDRVMEADAPAR